MSTLAEGRLAEPRPAGDSSHFSLPKTGTLHEAESVIVIVKQFIMIGYVHLNRHNQLN
jgi:hypothetical protein